MQLKPLNQHLAWKWPSVKVNCYSFKSRRRRRKKGKRERVYLLKEGEKEGSKGRF